GSSATGLFAIQLAVSVGAKVATTCSQRNFSLLEKLGYKITQVQEEIINDDQRQLFVIDYNTKDFGEELRGKEYDVVFDCVGGEQQWISAQKILKQGVFSSEHHGYIMHFLSQTPEDLDDIRITYIETGKVKPIIDTVYDLQKDGVEALYSLYEKSKSGKAQGKLVLKIAD
ncbi:unnamed protein product, partial [Adineta steineri]